MYLTRLTSRTEETMKHTHTHAHKKHTRSHPRSACFAGRHRAVHPRACLAHSSTFTLRPCCCFSHLSCEEYLAACKLVTLHLRYPHISPAGSSPRVLRLPPSRSPGRGPHRCKIWKDTPWCRGPTLPCPGHPLGQYFCAVAAL